MSNDKFILTTKDFTILEAMCDHPLGRHDPLWSLVQRKIAKAVVVFREDLPGGIASINSRVRYRVNGGASDTRVVSTGQVTAPIGMFLPITTLRGMALLGLVEGQDIVFDNADGVDERVLLEKVEYQPEASSREHQALGQGSLAARRQPLLRVISGGASQTPCPVSVGPDDCDDPAPSAA